MVVEYPLVGGRRAAKEEERRRKTRVIDPDRSTMMVVNDGCPDVVDDR